MLNSIIKFSLKNRLIVLLSAIILLIAGGYNTLKMEIDVFPDLTAPTVVIMTEAHGMAPEEVERMVTFPIETAINGATNIRRVRSSSALGFSLVWAEFDWGTDIYRARQTITERLIQVNSLLPAGVSQPVIAPQTSLMGEIIIFGLSSDEVSPIDLRTFAEWNVRPRLLSIGGVAQVIVIGGEFKEYQILMNTEKMRFYDVSLDELIAASKGVNENVPGGFINEYGSEYIIRGIARTTQLNEIGSAFIKMNDGKPVQIRDVAEIKIGAAPKIGDASINGKQSVLITIAKQPGINTIELSENIREEIDAIKRGLEKDITFHTGIMEQAEFIQTSINNVQKALFEGAILVVVILFLFLMNSRTTLISVLAIPLSMLTGFMVLKMLGISMNTMTLGGMTIAIGSLVDDAIIDVENVYKRLRENIEKPEHKRLKPRKVIFEASTEIRSSIFNATLIIIVAFIPLFFLSGMEGRLLKPLGLAYIIALFASLLVALTITPVLCNLLLVSHKNYKNKEHGSRFSRFLNKVYNSSLQQIINYKRTLLTAALIVFVFSLGLLFRFGSNFLPPFNEGALTINFSAMPGISLEESNKIGEKAENILLSFPEIELVGRRTGRAELAEHSFGVNVSELDVPFELKDRSRDEFLEDLRQQLNEIPGANVEVGQPITHRINHMLSGTKAAIAIKLFGDDLTVLYEKANEIKSAIAEIEGIGDLNVEQQVEVPQIKIRPKRELLARYGISVSEFNQFIDFSFAGEKVDDVFEGEKAFDLVLRNNEEFRSTKQAIENAYIDTWDGKKIPLSNIAYIESSLGANAISRENVMRKIVISVNASDRDLGSLVKEIRRQVNANVSLPDSYRVEYGGQFESAKTASQRIALTSLLAILIMFVILYYEFKSAKLAGIIMLNLPLALIGGIFAIWFSSGVISIPAIIGFITLFGIATRNGILLISRYEQLRRKFPNIKERIIHGSTDRLNPILMTALTAALALIPLSLAGDKPGNEIQSPMAMVILGGLLSSTLLNLYVIPIVYLLFSTKQNNK